MASLIDTPFLPTVVACLAAGLVLGLLARLATSPLPASLIPAVVFLAAYVTTYQKVPGFPPVGSTNKIFYVAVFGTALGLLVDLLALTGRAGGRLAGALARLGALAVPIAIAAWIALPRFVNPDPEFLLPFAALVIGGAAALWRLWSVALLQRMDGGEMVASAMLASLALGFAPIALFGASSTSLGLCLGFAVGLAAASLLALLWPRGFGATALLGAGSGLLAVVDTVALITQRVDWLALALLLAVLVTGQWGARLLLRSSGRPGWLHRLSAALLSAVPVPLIVAMLFLRHPNPIG